MYVCTNITYKIFCMPVNYIYAYMIPTSACDDVDDDDDALDDVGPASSSDTRSCPECVGGSLGMIIMISSGCPVVPTPARSCTPARPATADRSLPRRVDRTEYFAFF